MCCVLATIVDKWRFVLAIMICCWVAISECVIPRVAASSDRHLWSNLADKLIARQMTRDAPTSSMKDVQELRLDHAEDEFPIGLYQDLTKISSFPTAMFGLANNNVSEQCLSDSLFYVDSLLTNGNKWAIQMFQSSGQLSAAGVMESGHYHANGLFDQCLAVRSVPYRFRGKYCTVFFKLVPIDSADIERVVLLENNQDENQPAKSSELYSIWYILRRIFGSSVRFDARLIQPQVSSPDLDAVFENYPSFSLCLPSSCSASDLRSSVADLIGRFIIGNHSIVTLTDEKVCATDDGVRPPIDGSAFLVLFVLVLVSVLTATGTLHEAWRTSKRIPFDTSRDKKIVSTLHCFSALKNGRVLLDLQSNSSRSPDNISCLNGIRLVSAVIIVLFHSLFKLSLVGKSYAANPSTFSQVAKSWQLSLIANGTIAVDSFFLMSGLLVAYHLLPQLDSTAGKLNLWRMYVTRYLRLTPFYAFVIGVHSTVSVYLGSGPNWYNIVDSSLTCRQNWWKHLLYINNLFPFSFKESCFGDSWYLAADMQLYLMAPLLVYVLWRWKGAGLLASILLIVASLSFNVALVVIYKLPWTIIGSQQWAEWTSDSMSFFDLIYFKPWTRAPPYLIGILTGYFLRKTQHAQFKLSVGSVTFLWSLAVGTLLFVIFGTSASVSETIEPGSLDWMASILYGSFHRMFWALALSWVVIACTRGYGGFVNGFLSWNGFLPLSRMTYCVYIIQFNMIHLYYGLAPKQIFFSPFDFLLTQLGLLVCIFALAFVFSLLIETPFIHLTRLLFPQQTKSCDKLQPISNRDVNNNPLENRDNLTAKEKMKSS